MRCCIIKPPVPYQPTSKCSRVTSFLPRVAQASATPSFSTVKQHTQTFVKHVIPRHNSSPVPTRFFLPFSALLTFSIPYFLSMPCQALFLIPFLFTLLSKEMQQVAMVNILGEIGCLDINSDRIKPVYFLLTCFSGAEVPQCLKNRNRDLPSRWHQAPASCQETPCSPSLPPSLLATLFQASPLIWKGGEMPSSLLKMILREKKTFVPIFLCCMDNMFQKHLAHSDAAQGRRTH